MSTGFQEFDFSSGTHATEATPVEPESFGNFEMPAASESDTRHVDLLRQELESVDFYLAQGYTDIALDTLDMLERQFGAHADIDLRRAQIQETEPAATASNPSTAAESVEFSGFTRYDVAEEESASTETASEIDDAFMHLGAAPPAPAAVVESAASHVESPVPVAGEKPKAGIDPGLAAIFDEFRTAVEDEEPPVSDSDYETHYNLGLAYKEMDLLDEAIEEFQTAASLVAPQDGTPRYLQCCNLLGHCFIQKGMPRLAVMWFKKGLDAPGHTEDEYQALRFELGTAYEQMGDLDQAIDVFTEVYGINVSYRGVSDKLRELQALKSK